MKEKHPTLTEYVANPFAQGWLTREVAGQRGNFVPIAFVDINEGSETDAKIFSQIMYWHTPTQLPDGEYVGKLTVWKDGQWWLRKTWAEWFAETRIRQATAKRSIQRIERRNLIVVNLLKAHENNEGSKQPHIRVNWFEFQRRMELWMKVQGRIGESKYDRWIERYFGWTLHPDLWEGDPWNPVYPGGTPPAPEVLRITPDQLDPPPMQNVPPPIQIDQGEGDQVDQPPPINLIPDSYITSESTSESTQKTTVVGESPARPSAPERESHHPKAAAADQSASLKIKSIDSKPSPEASRLAKTPTPPVSPPPPKRVPPKVRQVEADPHWRAFVGTFDDEAAPPVTDANAGSLLAAIETMRARGITPEDVAETTRWKLSEPRRKPYRFEYVITDVYERRQIKPKKGRAGQAIHDPDFLLSTPTGCETIIGDPHQSDFMKRLARETLAEKWHVYDPKGMRVVDLPDDFDLDEAERLFE